MKIVQIAHSISHGDAASNQILAMDKMLKKHGFHTMIFADKIDSQIKYEIFPFSQFRYQNDMKIIFHFSTGTSFVNKVLELPSNIILYYHNITPPQYFEEFAWGSYFAAKKGRQQLALLKEKTSFAWAASEYSRLELEEAGFVQTAVLPIIVDFEEYTAVAVDQQIFDAYKDGTTNFLFVGRVTPHKRQDDIIRIFFYYKNFINPKSRLFLIGGHKKGYVSALQKLIKELLLEDSVVLANKVSFTHLCAYYRISDAFICMSEHEGFCVPLLEAMFYKLPIFAYNVAAVPYTLGASGVLFDEKAYPHIAETMAMALRDPWKASIINAQDKRLSDFSPCKIAENLARHLQAQH